MEEPFSLQYQFQVPSGQRPFFQKVQHGGHGEEKQADLTGGGKSVHRKGVGSLKFSVFSFQCSDGRRKTENGDAKIRMRQS
jgi:hypothetical protein